MKKANILLVDDDPVFLFLTRKILNNAGCLEKVSCVAHAKEAREYLDFCIEGELPFPDAIFLDIDMPGIGGMDFAELYSRRYADRFPDTKLVMLTSSISWKDRAKALEIPAVRDFVQKPLTAEKLNSLLLG